MSSPGRIDCGLCILRPWRRDDRPALLRYANNRNVARNLRDLFPHPYTEKDADFWLAYAAADEPPPWVYAIEVEGEAAGGISLKARTDVHRFGAEVGYWLGEPFWGRGIMTAVLKAFTEAALHRPDLYRIDAGVFSWNPASMRVLEKAGYRREGIHVRSVVKEGVLLDQVIYAITIEAELTYVPARQ